MFEYTGIFINNSTGNVPLQSTVIFKNRNTNETSSSLLKNLRCIYDIKFSVLSKQDVARTLLIFLIDGGPEYFTKGPFVLQSYLSKTKKSVDSTLI